MVSRFFRSFFWAVLVAFAAVWLHFGLVSASTREAVLIEDRFYGIEEEIVRPGEATFVPNRVFPGRVVLHRVDVGPRVLSLEFGYPLEQSEMLGLDESYAIQVHLRLEYRLDVPYLQTMFQRLDEPNWERLDPYLGQRLDYFLNRQIRTMYTGNQALPGLREELYRYVANALVGELNTEFQREGVVFLNALPTRIYVPDRDRYVAALTAGQRYLDQNLNRIRTIEDARANRRAEEIRDEAYLARLERVGELLRRYPQLRDYVAVDRLNDNVEVMIMPSERWFGSQAPAAQSPQPLLPRFDRFDPLRRDEATPPATAPGAEGQFRDLTPP